MTQLEAARRGIVTPEMRRVALREDTTAELIRDEVARGRLVIPANVRHLAGSGGREPRPTDAVATPATSGAGAPARAHRARMACRSTVCRTLRIAPAIRGRLRGRSTG